VWAESFDRNGPGALAIQEDVAGRIARALRIELLDESRLATKSPAAHEAYLRGRQLWHRRDTPSVEASVRELREAVRLDPRFVLAHIALAESIHTLAMRERIPADEAAAEIRAASKAALTLAPSLAQSHAITAMLHFWYDWDWGAAEESYRSAIALNPGEPGALHDHGWLLITRGAADEGIAEIRRAQELDPVSPRANMHVAWAYIYTRRFPEAIREARRALELSPGMEEAYACLERAYLLNNDAAGARAARSHLPPRGKGNASEDPYNRAVEFALAGNREGALQWLATAKESRNLSFPLAGVDPKLDILHGDPRFTGMLADVGLRAFSRPRRR
jgi:Tfp pilus assembly protein PilF